MISLAQGPLWFVWPAVIISLLGALVLGAVAVLSMRSYVVTRSDRWLRFGASFVLLSVASLAQALLQVGLLVKGFVPVEGGVLSLSIAPHLVRSSVFFAAVFALEFAFLFGLFLLWTTYYDAGKSVHGLVAFLLALLLWFSVETYYVFHLVALVFLLLISSSLIVRYREKRHPVTKWFGAGFGVLILGRLCYLLVPVSSLFVVAAEAVRLLGFVVLLSAFIKLLSHAKKKSS